MISLLIKSLKRLDIWRKRTKLYITLALLNMVMLAATELIISFHNKQLLDPVASIVGLFWIISTAVFIWLRGRVVLDLVIFGESTDDKAAKVVFNVLTIYFFLLLSIVSFHLVFPFWKIWPAYPVLIIVLFGWLTSGHMAKEEFDWNKARSSYILLAGVMTALIVLVSSYGFFSGESISVEIVRKTLMSTTGKIGLIGTVLFVIGCIGDMKKFQSIGFTLMAISIILLVFSGEIGAISKSSPTRPQEKIHPLSGTFVLPAGNGIYTTKAFLPAKKWILLKPDKRIDVWDDTRKRKVEILPEGETIYCQFAGKLKIVMEEIPIKVSWQIL